MKRLALALAISGVALTQFGTAQAQQSSLQGMAAAHAAANGVPMSLVHRVIMRESRYNARAVSKGNYGIMQIRLGTARAMGYTGSAAGLLDPNTNMTYAVKYLAGAYRAAGGNESRAVAYYAGGYYNHAKRQGFSPYTQQASYRRPVETAKYSFYVPQQTRRSYRRAQMVATADTNYGTSRYSRRAQRAQSATLFSWLTPSPVESRHVRQPRRVASTWHNPLAGLFPETSRTTKNVRYARYSRYTPSYY